MGLYERAGGAVEDVHGPRRSRARRHDAEASRRRGIGGDCRTRTRRTTLGVARVFALVRRETRGDHRAVEFELADLLPTNPAGLLPNARAARGTHEDAILRRGRHRRGGFAGGERGDAKTKRGRRRTGSVATESETGSVATESETGSVATGSVPASDGVPTRARSRVAKRRAPKTTARVAQKQSAVGGDAPRRAHGNLAAIADVGVVARRGYERELRRRQTIRFRRGGGPRVRIVVTGIVTIAVAVTDIVTNIIVFLAIFAVFSTPRRLVEDAKERGALRAARDDEFRRFPSTPRAARGDAAADARPSDAPVTASHTATAPAGSAPTERILSPFGENASDTTPPPAPSCPPTPSSSRPVRRPQKHRRRLPGRVRGGARGGDASRRRVVRERGDWMRVRAEKRLRTIAAQTLHRQLGAGAVRGAPSSGMNIAGGDADDAATAAAFSDVSSAAAAAPVHRPITRVGRIAAGRETDADTDARNRRRQGRRNSRRAGVLADVLGPGLEGRVVPALFGMAVARDTGGRDLIGSRSRGAFAFAPGVGTSSGPNVRDDRDGVTERRLVAARLVARSTGGARVSSPPRPLGSARDGEALVSNLRLPFVSSRPNTSASVTSPPGARFDVSCVARSLGTTDSNARVACDPRATRTPSSRRRPRCTASHRPKRTRRSTRDPRARRRFARRPNARPRAATRNREGSRAVERGRRRPRRRRREARTRTRADPSPNTSRRRRDNPRWARAARRWRWIRARPRPGEGTSRRIWRRPRRRREGIWNPRQTRRRRRRRRFEISRRARGYPRRRAGRRPRPDRRRRFVFRPATPQRPFRGFPSTRPTPLKISPSGKPSAAASCAQSPVRVPHQHLATARRKRHGRHRAGASAVFGDEMRAVDVEDANVSPGVSNRQVTSGDLRARGDSARVRGRDVRRLRVSSLGRPRSRSRGARRGAFARRVELVELFAGVRGPHPRGAVGGRGGKLGASASEATAATTPACDRESVSYLCVTTSRTPSDPTAVVARTRAPSAEADAEVTADSCSASRKKSEKSSGQTRTNPSSDADTAIPSDTHSAFTAPSCSWYAHSRRLSG